MTRIRPFRALRYDPARVDLSRVIAPPYDVIAPDERETWYERDPHNAIRLELTRDVEDEPTSDYAQIRRALAQWQGSGVLMREARPALYGLRQRFSAPDGTSHLREGIFALLHLEDYERGVVRPHERTLEGPKVDRLRVIRAARANLSSVFLLYEDGARALENALAPIFDREAGIEVPGPNGDVHTLVCVEDPAAIEAVQSHLKERVLVIADGHHRYETALAYRDECRAERDAPPDAPCEWILAYLANAFAPGNLLLPIHRLVRKGAPPTPMAWSQRLPGWSSRELPATRAESIPALLAEHLCPLRDVHAFAIDDGSGTLQLFSKPADGDLTVRLVERAVIEGVFGLDPRAVAEGAIGYPADALQAAREVRAGCGALAIYLNPLAPGDIFRVTAAGELLPQKSTFFYPKLPTGLVFRTFEEGE